ncbi:hypothetical protein [Cohnella sp.]|uniref:hypothetical protein n=1 Tax=Cohnella sp. TaxID=1883426 RepID=UPI00356924CB
MDFEQAYKEFMASHIEKRTGERKGRLLSRDFHGEKLFLQNIWWVLKGNLEHLHPEYEVLDWRNRPYFIDFAWKPPGNIIFLLEIKGFAKHVRDMDRNGYCNETNRETFLEAIGYRVISFAYDDVADRPDLCITLLRLFISQFHADEAPVTLSVLAEREIIRLALRLARPFRPIDVTRHLGINHKTTMNTINRLVTKVWVVPIRRGRGERAVQFQLAKGIERFF